MLKSMAQISWILFLNTHLPLSLTVRRQLLASLRPVRYSSSLLWLVDLQSLATHQHAWQIERRRQRVHLLVLQHRLLASGATHAGAVDRRDTTVRKHFF
jgi:hypothetical protein